MPKTKKVNLQDDEFGKKPSQIKGVGVEKISNYAVIHEEWYEPLLSEDDTPNDPPEGQPNFFNKKGRWVIQFPAGSRALDQAWEQVEKGIGEGGVFFEANVTRLDGNKPQYISIFTYDYTDKDDVHFVHQNIVDLGIMKGALNEGKIEYFAQRDLNKADESQKTEDVQPRYTSESLKTPDFAQTTVSAKESLETVKQSFIKGLENYIAGRHLQEDQRKKSYIKGGFFDRLSTAMSELSEKVTGMTTEVKVEAAEKMIFALKNPDTPVSFTHDEISALSSDKLGNVLKAFPDILPKQYLEAVKLDAQDIGKPRW